MNKPVVGTLMYFLIFLNYLHFEHFSSDVKRNEISLSKRSIPTKSCFTMLSECRNNVSCQVSYRRVKKRCESSLNLCNAGPRFLTMCAIQISYLQSTTFNEKCDCSLEELRDVNRILKCTDIFNMIFANPCHDHGLTALEQERALGATTMRAAIDSESHVATSNSKSGDQSPTPEVNKTTDMTTPFVEEKDLNDVSVHEKQEMTKEKSENNIKNRRPPKPTVKLTEKEFEDLDSFFAMDDDEPVHREPIKIPDLQSNDVIDDKKFTAASTHENKQLNFAENNNRPSKNNRPEVDLSSHYLDDVNNNIDHNNEQEVTDANNEVARVVFAKFMGKTLEPDLKNTVYNLEEKNRQVLESRQTMRYEADVDMNNQNTSRSLNTTETVLIVLGSISLLLVTLGGLLCYKRVNRNDYMAGKFLKKSCQSAIIVQAICEDNNLKVKRKTDHV